jgi:subtilisin family serine protease
MLKEKFLTLLLGLLFFNGSAQNGEHAWIYFNDKPNSASYLSNPETMLSQRALDRRNRYDIELDLFDVPVDLNYMQQIDELPGIEVVAKSKRLKAVHVIGNVDAIRATNSLSFVDLIEFASNNLNESNKPVTVQKTKSVRDKWSTTADYNYGAAENQITLMNGDYLHKKDFTGSGMVMALMDGGFPNVDSHPIFERIRNNGQLLGGYNFVDRNTNFYSRHSHGMSVLSSIAGYMEGQLVGTAPDAQFYLFITEDTTQETPLEESLWVEAAERADSLGVDVINTSLGYFTFDNPNYDYSYGDMDGETTFISRGATIAFSRGMVILTSAGNEGNDPWHYIIAPADAPNVLGIGAVDNMGNSAFFSSYGPTPDGRIKPDVSAQGQGVFVLRSNGDVAPSNGTSFSSPILAGAVTCFWQAYPELTNKEVVDLVRKYGHLYPNSTSQMGYGIPDFKALFLDLEEENYDGDTPLIYPNPVVQTAYFKLPKEMDRVEVKIMNALGQTTYNQIITRFKNEMELEFLPAGVYMVKITPDNGKSATVIKMIKN